MKFALAALVRRWISAISVLACLAAAMPAPTTAQPAANPSLVADVDRVSILVNRVDKRQTGASAIAKMEALLQKKVFLTIPNSYAEVQKALVEGRPVKPNTDLGASIAKLAQAMLPDLAAPAPERPRSLLDAFVSRKPEAASKPAPPMLGSESVG